jgi:hypothetical protein
MDKPIGIYAKLIKARVMLQSRQINKSGHNKFAGYKYFELADFLPAVQDIFAEVGLVDVIQFTADVATMHLIDTQDGSSVVFTSPMGSAQLKGCHEVQNIGAVETYQRRYLYVAAMAIVEHDALDASEPIKEEPEKPKAKPKLETVKGKDSPWQITIAEKEPGGFSGALKECTDLLLGVCESAENVNAIFQTNRALYDKLKEENKVIYEEILEAFKTRKTSFQ